MIRVRISEDALADLEEGRWFYEAQEPGLGDYFSACLRADIERLKISAGIHPIVYKDYHRLFKPNFSLRIFYTAEESGAIVWAVIDLRRDSEWIHNHLSK